MAEYSIDEIARAAGSTVRNVRSYQTKGLLPAPRRVGRRNVYSESHLSRLRLIASLLSRGFTLSSIVEVLTTFDRGEGVSELLGLEAALTSPWSSEMPSQISAAELAAHFGDDVDPELLQRAIELDLVREDGDRFLVPSARLLSVGAELIQAGIPLPVLLDQIAELRVDIERIARRFVGLIVSEVFDRFGDGLPPADERHRLTALVHRVRPMATRAVEVEMARALESAINDELGNRLQRFLTSKDSPGKLAATAEHDTEDTERDEPN